MARAVRARRSGRLAAALAPALAAALGPALALALAAGAERAARADAVYLLSPSATIGVTDNAAATQVGPRLRDEFLILSLAANMHLEGRSTSHNLAGQLAFTRFLGGHGRNTLTSLLGWTSAFKLSAVLDLGLGASGSLSRTSSVDVTDLTLAVPQGSAAGTTLVFTGTASQTLLYQPTPRRSYAELLSVARVRYLDAPITLPDTTLVSGTVKGTWSAARDAAFLEARMADTISDIDESVPVGTFARGHTLIAQVLAGWQRDYSPVWSSILAAGPSITFKLAGPAVIAPVGSASLSYKRRPWFATATVAQTAAANIYLGEATINDQAMVRVALPLTRSELVFVTGFASYLYARAARNDATLTRLFDQLSAGASLSARLLTLPLAASLQYTIIDQRGGTVEGRTAPGLVRQTLMLTVSGVLAWGPGTPPLFSGVP